MNKLILAAAALSLSLGGCAEPPSDHEDFAPPSEGEYLAPPSNDDLLAVALSEPSDHEDHADLRALLRKPQVVAFLVATPAEKAAMMRAHFVNYAARPGLTDAQRAACLGMLPTVSEVAFGPRDTPEWGAWANHDAGEVDAVTAAFGEDLKAIEEVLHTID